MRIASLVLIAPLTLAMAACGTVSEAVRGPALAPMGYPSALVGTDQVVKQTYGHREEVSYSSPNSLWRTGARTFFNDQRAGKIGDILTVLITIDDSAQVSNATSRERKVTSAAGVPHLLGLESSLGKYLPKAFDPSKAIDATSDSTNQGTGSVNRQEKINLTVAAVVSRVLPNGNLVIQGHQEVKTNAEVRELTISGIVRPEDISSSNTINHTQIAEARIAYDGRGDISRIQKSPYGQSLVEAFSPF
jgi:flagellar L-ring protein precursor FlgH